MVFLKKIYAEGFKSFATPTTLNFDQTMIGIVGPNGSGKSNIVDALKWCIGEQSIKALRGKERSNLIFAGSKDMDEANFALVEITFNNEAGTLNYPNKELKISRKLVRKTGESIFQINDEPAKLKEIQDIFLDSGLTKGSLGIISQGTVNWFAEAKPEERRHMFEEAAGIGRYTKQKEETIDLLEKAMINLGTLSQHTSSLKRDINDLERQAEKAAFYQSKFEELKKLDVSLSVQDVLAWQEELKGFTEDERTYKEQVEETLLALNESKALKDKVYQDYVLKETEWRKIVTQKEELSDKVTKLNIKQNSYRANLESKTNSSNLEERKKSYQLLIQTDKLELESLKKQLLENTDKHNDADLKVKELSKNRKDSFDRYNSAFKEFSEIKNNLNNMEEALKTINSRERGVEAILRAKDNLAGVHTTVNNVLKVPEEYEIAIQTAFAKSLNDVIVDTSDNAVNAVNYLKENNAGRATFLPLDTIKPKEIREDSLLIMSKIKGFIGQADSLVQFEKKYENIIKNLVGNVAIADVIENANTIAKMTNHNYKIITLDGDIIFSGGAISGGQVKSFKPAFNIAEKIEKLKEDYERKFKILTKVKVEYETLDNQSNDTNIEMRSLEGSIKALRTRISDLEKRIIKNETDYESIVGVSANKENLEAKISDSERELIELNKNLNDLTTLHDSLYEQRNLAYEINHKETSRFTRLQETLNEYQNKLSKTKEKIIYLNAELEKTYDKLSFTYSLTLESAIEKYSEPLEYTTSQARVMIHDIKADLDRVGKINYEAADTLKVKQAEYDTLQIEKTAAEESVKELKEVLDDLDKRAKFEFSSIINKVNQIIPQIFTNLFGGGKCEITYTNPDNILESGIDIIVQPLGKKISTLVLLSGGEKTLVALTVLFALLKSSSSFPLVVLDEAEAALDQANVSTFARLIQEFSDSTQFLVITHRTGTMKMCDVLYGTTMQVKGVTRVIKTNLEEIKKMSIIKTN